MTPTTRVPVGAHHHALIDLADRRLVEGRNWHLLRGHNGKLYAYTTGAIYMHRLIASTPTGKETDHVNGDGLDNRRVNLRTASASQNRANMWKPRRPDGSPHSSIYKGVSWDKSRGLWQSKIAIHGRHRNLGRYGDALDAALAYDAAAIEAWGEFAQLNFPDRRVAA